MRPGTVDGRDYGRAATPARAAGRLRAPGEGDRGQGKGGLTPPTSAPMTGEHRQLNTDFPWVGDLRNNQLKFKTA
jgi:hypothetical protein